MIDSLKAGREYRNIRELSQRSPVWGNHTINEVRQHEVFDVTITAERMYGSRADWYATAAVAGFVDVDTPLEVGVRFFPTVLDIAKIQKQTDKTRLY